MWHCHPDKRSDILSNSKPRVHKFKKLIAAGISEKNILRIEYYCPDKNGWKTLTTTEIYILDLFSIALYDEKLIICGGKDSSSFSHAKVSRFKNNKQKYFCVY